MEIAKSEKDETSHSYLDIIIYGKEFSSPVIGYIN